MFFKKQKIYMDHASATPVDSQVEAVMKSYFSHNFFNPSALYQKGQEIKFALENARMRSAQLFQVNNNEVFFVNGGTESNSMAIQGVVSAFRFKNPEKTPHVIISTIEHSAIRETARALEKKGLCTLSEVSVNEKGFVNIDELKKLLSPETIVVSVIYANNEIGVVQPLHDIAKLIRWYRKQIHSEMYPLFHTDAIQAVNYCDIKIPYLGVDMLSCSGAKIYGPKGIALLVKKNYVPWEPLIFGGSQESGVRAGTENVPLIMGLVRALELSQERKEFEVQRLKILTDIFFQGIEDISKKNNFEILVNGDRKQRLPNNVNISVSGLNSEQMVIELDALGIQCSSQSSCTSESGDGSYVIQALRPESDIISGSLRFTLGRSTEKRDIVQALHSLEKILVKLQNTRQRFLTVTI